MNVKDYSLWTALVTPLMEDGAVDFETLSNLVKEQTSAGNGLLILGSTGEALNLSLEDRKAIIEHVVNMKPSSPIMVGVGGNLLNEQLDWVSYLETLNLHAYLLVTPHYAKPGPKGQHDWFKAIMDSVSRPVMLYNVPGRTATPLALGAVELLKDHKNFWAIKEASGSVEKMKEYLKACGGKAVYSGDDALLPDFTRAGAVGLVSVASNAWPHETNLYVKQCLNKSFDAIELWTNAANSLFICSNPVPVKCLMAEKGTIRSPKMIAPLSHEDMPSMTAVLEAQRAVSFWFSSQGAQK